VQRLPNATNEPLPFDNFLHTRLKRLHSTHADECRGEQVGEAGLGAPSK
jgi:hypothetical protein